MEQKNNAACLISALVRRKQERELFRHCLKWTEESFYVYRPEVFLQQVGLSYIHYIYIHMYMYSASGVM